MKNKIVKALVLASIVSMTATGAAGLTFAEDAPKTIDQLAKDVTDDQTAADKAKAEFDKAYAYLDAKDAAATAFNKLLQQEGHTEVDINTVLRSLTQGSEAETLINNFIGVNGFYSQLKDAEQNLLNNPDSKDAYEEAKTRFESEKDILLNKDALKDVKEALTAAFDGETEARTAFEDAVKAVKDAKPKGTDEEVRKALSAAGKKYEAALTALTAAKTAYDDATKGAVPIYRLYHPGTGEHLYTNSTNERDTLVKGGIWKDEKVAMLATKKGADDAVPVYRVCYPLTGDHHYTTDKNEVTTLIKTQGWVDEDIAFYAKTTGKGVSVYRLYNKGLKLGAHHFTTGLNEYNSLEDHGWRKEGVAFDALAADYVDTSAIETKDARVPKAKEYLGGNWLPD